MVIMMWLETDQTRFPMLSVNSMDIIIHKLRNKGNVQRRTSNVKRTPHRPSSFKNWIRSLYDLSCVLSVIVCGRPLLSRSWRLLWAAIKVLNAFVEILDVSWFVLRTSTITFTNDPKIEHAPATLSVGFTTLRLTFNGPIRHVFRTESLNSQFIWDAYHRKYSSLQIQ